jgi:hypothetical protein
MVQAISMIGRADDATEYRRRGIDGQHHCRTSKSSRLSRSRRSVVDCGTTGGRPSPTGRSRIEVRACRSGVRWAQRVARRLRAGTLDLSQDGQGLTDLAFDQAEHRQGQADHRDQRGDPPDLADHGGPGLHRLDGRVVLGATGSRGLRSRSGGRRGGRSQSSWSATSTDGNAAGRLPDAASLRGCLDIGGYRLSVCV